MNFRLTCLSTAERDLVIESALAILQDVGMRLPGARAMDALAGAGAHVDRETGVVRIPEDVVRAALATLPETMVIAGATPQQDVRFDRRSGPFFNPSAAHAKTLDFRTGQLRASTLQDIKEGTAVMDATPELNLLWTFATANDVPIEERELVEYYTFLTTSAKPLVMVDCPTDTEAVKRIMDVLGDGLEGFRQRPRLGLLCAARAPLAVNGALIDAACELASLGAPIWTYTMPMSGATSPVTMGGTLALMWAETLGMVTAIQAAAPGTGVMACCGPGVLDMRTSSMALGAPENTLLGVASVEIAHHLGLPVHNTALSTDAKHPGIQAGYEKGLKVLPAAMAGADLISGGFGALAASSVWHLPMVPIDAEIARLVRRLVAETKIDRDSVMLDVIERVGIGGDYLKEKSTRQLIRAGEHFSPTVGSRLPFEQWAELGQMEVDVAREIVEQTLAASEERTRDGWTAELSAGQVQALAEICGVG